MAQGKHIGCICIGLDGFCNKKENNFLNVIKIRRIVQKYWFDY